MAKCVRLVYRCLSRTPALVQFNCSQFVPGCSARLPEGACHGLEMSMGTDGLAAPQSCTRHKLFVLGTG